MATSVKIRYWGIIQTIVEKSEEEIRIKTKRASSSHQSETPNSIHSDTLYLDALEDVTVGRVLKYLACRYGLNFTYYTQSADGSLPTHALIIVDGVNLGHRDVLEQKIGEKSLTEIIVVPAVGGG